MKSIKDKIKSSFSKAALTYDKFAEIQNIISDKMVLLLKDKLFHNVLEIGSGTGNYTEKLIKLNKDAKFVLIDSANPMMEQAKKKLLKYKIKANFIVMDAENITNNQFPSNYFDLITSNSTLQWFSDLNKFFSKIYHILASNGIFLFSYCGHKTYIQLNTALKKYYKQEKIQLPAVRFLSKEKIKNLIKKIFSNCKIEEYKIKREYNDLYSLLQKIRQCGEYGYGLGQKSGLTRSSLEKIEKIYKDKYKKIVATNHYYIIFIRKL